MCKISPLRVSIFTFGCRVNQYESEAMRATLAGRFTLVDEEPDVAILNACTVTQLAERKARQLARRLRRERPGTLILVVGCLADAVNQGLARFSEAELLAGNAWKHRIEDVVRRALAGDRGALPEIATEALDVESVHGSPRRLRAYLKVQDGCSGTCSYCRPTQVRGPSRSKSVRAAADEASRLVRLGHPEIVLTGVNLAEYAPPDGDLASLMRAVLANDGLRRLRLASINPSGITDRLLAVFRDDPRVCPHFHIPLQSADDRILRAMRRRYSSAGYRHAVERIRRQITDATLGTDIIVGFPGEDAAAFAASRRAVEEFEYVNLHVFRYSPRQGTASAPLGGQVPEDEKRRRAEALNAAWSPIRRRLLDRRIGTTQDVLVEENRDGRWRGYTRDYIPVHFDRSTDAALGEERPVWITVAVADHLEGVDGDRQEAD